jgi:murein DD-endopeptidase MepM/ murein hydrolase activator NlpD
VNTQYTQSQNPSGGPLSLKQKIDTGASMADGFSQSILPFLRWEIGYSAVKPFALVGMPLVMYFFPKLFAELKAAFMPFGLGAGRMPPSGGLSPLMLFLLAGAVMGLWQRRQCWNNLNAGVLRNPYSRGESRLAPFLLNFRNGNGEPYIREEWIQRWFDPLAVFAAGWLLVYFGIGQGLGPYLMLGGIALKVVEEYVHSQAKEAYLNGIATLANAQSQSAVAQRFQNRPASERKNEAPAAGLSTGIGGDIAAKVEELKAKTEREGRNPPAGGGIAAVALLAVLLSGTGRAASVSASCACVCGVKGAPVETAALRSPLPEEAYVISSAFGMRMHPLLKVRMWHGGIDLAAPLGTPIHAAAEGVVEAAGFYGCDGNYVRLRHGDGVVTSYSHASRIAPGIVPGARVRAGQVIAFVGSTGCSTGPHLHYGLRVKGNRVNPALVCHLLYASCGCYRFQPPPEPRRPMPVVKRA